MVVMRSGLEWGELQTTTAMIEIWNIPCRPKIIFLMRVFMVRTAAPGNFEPETKTWLFLLHGWRYKIFYRIRSSRTENRTFSSKDRLHCCYLCLDEKRWLHKLNIRWDNSPKNFPADAIYKNPFSSPFPSHIPSHHRPFWAFPHHNAENDEDFFPELV